MRRDYLAGCPIPNVALFAALGWFFSALWRQAKESSQPRTENSVRVPGTEYRVLRTEN